ncbi:unnamed protein product [Phaeothamnion confervicola]
MLLQTTDAVSGNDGGSESEEDDSKRCKGTPRGLDVDWKLDPEEEGGARREETRPRKGPNKTQHSWTPEDDARVRQLVEKYGRNWTLVSHHMPLRTNKQIRERFLNHLDSDLKKTPWTPEEERIFTEAHELHGNQWANIARLLKGRTDSDVKNKWYATVRRQEREAKGKGGTSGGTTAGTGGSGGRGKGKVKRQGGQDASPPGSPDLAASAFNYDPAGLPPWMAAAAAMAARAAASGGTPGADGSVPWAIPPALLASMFSNTSHSAAAAVAAAAGAAAAAFLGGRGLPFPPQWANADEQGSLSNWALPALPVPPPGVAPAAVGGHGINVGGFDMFAFPSGGLQGVHDAANGSGGDGGDGSGDASNGRGGSSGGGGFGGAAYRPGSLDGNGGAKIGDRQSSVNV